MWPILACSLAALGVAIERILFLVAESVRRQPSVVDAMLDAVEQQEPDKALELGRECSDFVARTLCAALSHRREKSVSSAPWNGAGTDPLSLG